MFKVINCIKEKELLLVYTRENGKKSLEIKKKIDPSETKW